MKLPSIYYSDALRNHLHHSTPLHTTKTWAKWGSPCSIMHPRNPLLKVQMKLKAPLSPPTVAGMQVTDYGAQKPPSAGAR